MKAHDQETRERLLAAATRLFAGRGFAKVTVREICRTARANVAAVNYHFGGKKGLYDEVVRAAIETMQSTTRAMHDSGEGRTADRQLALYVSIFLRRIVAARDSWIHQLMVRELSDPTPALDLVLTQVVRPRMAYLRRIIAGLLGCPTTDARVERCAMSVQAQCLVLLTHPVAAVRPRQMSDRQLDTLADHIARFSLAGIRDLKT